WFLLVSFIALYQLFLRFKIVYLFIILIACIFASKYFAFFIFVFTNIVSVNLAPLKLQSVRLAPTKITLSKLVPLKLVCFKLDPKKSTPYKVDLLKVQFVIIEPLKFTCLNIELLKTPLKDLLFEKNLYSNRVLLHFE